MIQTRTFAVLLIAIATIVTTVAAIGTGIPQAQAQQPGCGGAVCLPPHCSPPPQNAQSKGNLQCNEKQG